MKQSSNYYNFSKKELEARYDQKREIHIVLGDLNTKEDAIQELT